MSEEDLDKSVEDQKTINTSRSTQRLRKISANERNFNPKMWATNHEERCPVMLFEEYIAHQPSAMCLADSAFWLAINYNQSNGKFLKSQKMGIKKINGFMKAMVEIRKPREATDHFCFSVFCFLLFNFLVFHFINFSFCFLLFHFISFTFQFFTFSFYKFWFFFVNFQFFSFSFYPFWFSFFTFQFFTFSFYPFYFLLFDKRIKKEKTKTEE